MREFTVDRLRWVLLGCLTVSSCRTPPKPAADPSGAPPASGRVVTIPTSNNPKPEPWGPPVRDQASIDDARMVLHAIALGFPYVESHLDDGFVIGPGLWRQLLQLDPTLGEIGLPVQSSIQPGPGKERVSLAGRMFTGRDVRRAIGRHSKFRAWAEAFRVGTTRAASAHERQAFYTLIPFEIEGQALTIFALSPDHRLAVFLRNRRLAWVDLLTEFFSLPPVSDPEEHRPSSPEQRAGLLRLVQRLEQDPPVDADPRAEISAMRDLVSSATDIDAVVCANLYSTALERPVGFEVMTLALLGTAAYSIERYGQHHDLVEMSTAALRSVLRAYASSRKRGGPVSPAFDEMQSREHDGSLEAFVREKTRTCFEEAEARTGPSR